MESFLTALVALSPGQVGRDVGNLQAVLDRLDLAADISDEERGLQRLGPLTARAVSQLFEMAGLGESPEGAISEDAAARLNEFLVAQHILEMVEGVVTDEAGAPAAGYQIRLFEARNLDGGPAAKTETDAEGKYRLFYDARWWLHEHAGVNHPTDAPELIVVALEPDGEEAARSDPTRDPEGRVRISLRVRGPIQRPIGRGRRRVRGWVENSQGVRLTGWGLEVFDRDIGPLTAGQRLGDTGHGGLGPDGEFSFDYDVAQIEPGEAPPPVADLVFRITDPRGRAATLFRVLRQPVEGDVTITAELPVPDEELPLGVPARDDEWVRIVVSGAAAPTGPAEFDTLLAALRPLLGERTPADLDEAEHHDVSFAARETGHDREKIADLALAFRLAAEAGGGAGPQSFYALARSLDLRTLSAIAVAPIEALVLGFERAIRTVPQIISDPGEELAALAARVRRQAAYATLGAGPQDGGALAQLIGNDLPDRDAQAALLAGFADHAGPTEDFWRNYAEANPEQPVAALQLSLQLGGLTGSNASLTAAIRTAYPEAQSLRALALELDGAKVAALVEQSGAPIPASSTDAPTATAKERYAVKVAAALDAAQPTAAVARLAGTWAAERPEAVAPETAELLRRIVLETDYELGSGRLDELVEAEGDRLFDNVNDPAVKARALSEAGRIERLYNISPGPGTLSTLAAAKPFRGAFDIARLGKTAFLAHFLDAPAQTLQELSEVHEAASATAEATASLLMDALQESSDPIIAATRSTAHPIPNWAQLFGTERLTDCEECRSLGGPTAYLVQVFEFLDKRCAPNAKGVTPLDVLIGNAAKGVAGLRPDLAHIKLSCENTNTTLPAVDLVNEVLESCLVFNSPLAQPPDASSAGVTASELEAEPENLKAKAYETLAGAVFPIGLPFDLVPAVVRSYLQAAGVSRAQLIASLAPNDEDRLAAERLGLADLDWIILTGEPATRAPKAQRLFGLEPGADGEAWADRLDASVLTAARLLGLKVNDLLALVATQFVSGDWPAADRTLLQRFPLDAATYKSLREANFADPAADVAALLEWLEIPLTELKAWTDRNQARLAKTIVVDPPNARRLDEMRLVRLDGSALDEADWLRLHRLVRLAQRASATITDLDLALTILSIDELDDVTLRKLGAFKALAERLKLDWRTTAGLFSDLQSSGLYDALFVHSGVARNVPAFRPDEAGAVLTGGGKLSDQAAGLAAAFGAPPTEIEAIAAAHQLADLTLAAVSTIWRDLRLARALDLNVADLLQMRSLMGQAVFPATDDPASLLAAVERAAAKANLVNAAAFSAVPLTGEDAAAVEAALKAVSQALAEPGDAPEERRRATAMALGEPLGMTGDLLAVLLTDDLPPSPRKALLRVGDHAGLDALVTGDEATQRALLAWARRLGTMVKALGIAPADLLILRAAQALPDLAHLEADPDPKALMAAWRKAEAYAEARTGRNPVRVAEALAALASARDDDWAKRAAAAVAAARPPRLGEAAATEAMAQAQIAGDARALLGLPFADAAQVDPISALVELDRRLALCARTGAPASALIAVADGSTGAAADEALAQLQKGLAARFDPASWLVTAREIHDRLRRQRRDALTAWWMNEKGLATDQALFSELLLDPRPEPAVLTSRVANAMLTAQRFVHAARLGMFNHAGRPAQERVDPAQINPEWDLYLHSFRMTQANFEVLANPYLYMAPDLRDDKTPIFKEVEGFLRQNDASAETAERAFAMYLERLGEVANLEVCGTFLQEDFEPQEAFRFTSILHVFGRSRSGAKRSYWYRRLNRYRNFEEWTPWEMVKVDIQGIERDRTGVRSEASDSKPEAGVHLLPVVWRRKLYIFWPSFVRKIHTYDDRFGIDLKTGASKSRPAKAYWEVKLCWSRRDEGGWSPRQISSDYFDTYVPVFEALTDA